MSCLTSEEVWEAGILPLGLNRRRSQISWSVEETSSQDCLRSVGCFPRHWVHDLRSGPPKRYPVLNYRIEIGALPWESLRDPYTANLLSEARQLSLLFPSPSLWCSRALPASTEKTDVPGCEETRSGEPHKCVPITWNHRETVYCKKRYSIIQLMKGGCRDL